MGKRKAEEEAAGVKTEKKSKKDKSEKKEKKEKKEDKGDKGEAETTRMCVPIAHPMSEDVEKLTPRVLAMVKYATKNKTMVRGIKEVTKIVRKGKAQKNALVVLAADISPLDVISHMPGLLDEKEVRYVWVPSRGNLGEATLSKRPTSAVIVNKVPEDKKEAYEKMMGAIAKMHKTV